MQLKEQKMKRGDLPPATDPKARIANNARNSNQGATVENKSRGARETLHRQSVLGHGNHCVSFQGKQCETGVLLAPSLFFGAPNPPSQTRTSTCKVGVGMQLRKPHICQMLFRILLLGCSSALAWAFWSSDLVDVHF